jgi:histidine triad (HIT) family protein
MTIFKKIIDRKISAYFVAEDENFIAFLDINPKSKGHTIVISKNDFTDYIFDIEEKKYQELFSFAKTVSLVLKKRLECKRISLVVAGFEVAHAHIHLIPSNSIDDIDLKKENIKMSKEEFAQLSKILSLDFKNLNKLG